MSPPEETKPAKVRAKAEYLIEVLCQDEQDASGDYRWYRANLSGYSPNSAKAEKWIRDNGEDGREYRVIRVVAGPFTIKTETKTLRRLT